MALRILARSAALAVVIAAGAAAAEPRHAAQFQWLHLDRHPVKWGSPQPGTGTEVTYAFVTAPRHHADARNCRDLVPLDGLLERSAVPHSVLEREAAAAFSMWQAVADIRFRRVDDQDQAQILIGAQAAPRGIAFADVAYHRSAAAGIRRISRSLICLNPEKPWKVGFSGDVTVYDLRYAIAHEAGHAIGLDHPSPSGQLMSFRYDELFRSLQPGDVAGVVALYGPRDVAAASVPALPGVADSVDADPGENGCGGGRENAILVTALAPRSAGCIGAPGG